LTTEELQFDEAYSRKHPAYGEQPSNPLAAFLEQAGHHGTAWDLGAGAGRDTIAVAKAGYEVHCYDLSKKGIERILQRAKENGVEDQVNATCADIRDVSFAPESLDLIVATTVLDHIPAENARAVWQSMVAAMTNRGVIYVEVHTTDDPGCKQCPSEFRNAPVSETASAVVNYFAPNQLARWAVDESTNLRILHYEERLEWDTTHGHNHLHGKAILLAEKQGAHRLWQGEVPVNGIAK
jgi:cyclopropane fatty-acyl-phospholipid synthase-like methyltransferase